MAKHREYEEVGPPRKKKESLGKLLEEFKPKSYRLELGLGACALFLISLPVIAVAPFMPMTEARWALFVAGVLLFFLAILVGLFCAFFGMGRDRVEIRQNGLRLKMGREVYSLRWEEIGEINSRTEYNPYIQHGKGTTKYACQMSTAQGVIELSERFFAQFEDPTRIQKLIRKHTGKTLVYIELPRG